jgi:D-inositol-3-phosphate glycosyltransferase
VDSHDPLDFAEAIERVITDVDLRRSLSVRAAEHAKSFGWEATTEGLLQTYRQALLQAPSSAAAFVT